MMEACRGPSKPPFAWLTLAAADDRPEILERQAVGGERRRVGLDPHGRRLSAADADQPDARQLRDLLGKPGVRQVFDLRQRQRLRSERQRQDRRVGRVDLAVDRRVRQIAAAGKLKPALIAACTSCSATSRVRSRLNCSVMTEAAAGAGGRHLLQAGHLAELPLQRSRDGRRHDLRAGAGIEGEHLDGRIIHLRQRGDRQLLVRHGAGQQDRGHEQRGRNRPQDELAGQVHFCGPFAPVVCSSTFAPSRRRSAPSTTIRSPGATPSRIDWSSPWAGPMDTGRISAVLSGFTT